MAARVTDCIIASLKKDPQKFYPDIFKNTQTLTRILNMEKSTNRHRNPI